METLRPVAICIESSNNQAWSKLARRTEKAVGVELAEMASLGYLALGMKLNRILETALYVPNLDEAEAFYTRLLNQEPFQRDSGRHVFFRLDEAMLLLFNPQTTLEENQDIPSHGSRGQGHVCFRIEEDQVEAWKSRLAELGIRLEVEHTWPNGSKSLYFRDPAGNSVELAPWRIWSPSG